MTQLWLFLNKEMALSDTSVIIKGISYSFVGINQAYLSTKLASPFVVLSAIASKTHEPNSL